MKKKTEHPLSALAAYLPEGSFDPVVAYLNQYKVVLTVVQERKTVQGDYRNAYATQRHRISVNGNLNKYAFLLTLLHELAHLLTFEQFGNRVFAHGNEWKKNYSQLLQTFIQHTIFPRDIVMALQASIRNPAASCGAEEGLMRVLRRYDPVRENVVLVEDLPPECLFLTKDGRIFKKGEKLRKRFRCVEIKSGSVYLFSPIYEVKKLNQAL